MKDDIVYIIAATCLIFSFGIGFMIATIIYNSKPTAMDVYRNKTTLEITYKDNVPIDSVVVFK